MNKENLSQDQSINKSRRKVTLSGLAVPVILSVSSRPVWATPGNCSFNQALSGNISINPDCNSTRACSISPGFYKSNQSRWGEFGVAYLPSTLFSAIFSHNLVYIPASTKGKKTTPRIDNPSIGTVFDCYPNIALVGHTDTSIHNACFHYIAAVLSASATNLVYPYSVAQIIADWAGSQSLLANIQAIQAGEYSVATAHSLMH